MSGLRQTWHHSERAAVAGVRLLGIGVLLLAVAVLAIYKFNPDKKPATPTATTAPAPETSTPETSTPETSTPETQLLTTMLPLKCDINKFALVATPDSPNILPTGLRVTAENFGTHAMIVSPQLCDSGKEKDREEAGLIFIGPFGSSTDACDFKRMISVPELIPHTTSPAPTPTQASRSPRDSGGSASSSSSVPKEVPTPPDWEVHNIRNLTRDPQSCEGN